MPLTHAITRAPSDSLARCELTHIDRSPIDLARARRQHQDYTRALELAGLDIIRLPALPDLPDSGFVEDAAVIFPEFAILPNMGSEDRRPESAALAPTIERFRRIETMPPHAHMDGGDVLKVGRTVFVGRSTRTNDNAITWLVGLLSPQGYRVIPIDVRGCLHLKTACTALATDTLIAHTAWIDPAPLAGFRIIDAPDPALANILAIGSIAIIPQTPNSSRLATRIAAALRPVVRDSVIVDISEFQKAEAGVTCLSLIL